MSDPKAITLDDLFEQARGFADYCLRGGTMRPTFFLHGLHPITPPPDPTKALIQMHVLATDMDKPETKNKVATLARLLNIANGSTHSVLALEVWMSQQQEVQPREADDRKEFIVLLGESHAGNTTRFYPIIRSDNGNYFGLGEMHTDKNYVRMSGRFANLLPPVVPDLIARQMAMAALKLMGLNFIPVDPH